MKFGFRGRSIYIGGCVHSRVPGATNPPSVAAVEVANQCCKPRILRRQRLEIKLMTVPPPLRRTATQDGYSGPCFIRGELPDTDDAETAIVAIPRFGVEAWDRGMNHKRQQFPLMLAWAVTGVRFIVAKKCGSTPCL